MDCIPYRQDKKIVTVTTTIKIKGEKVPEGYLLEVTHMSISDLDTADKLLELGYETLSEDEKILLANKGTQNYQCKLNGHVWIEGGEAPFGRVTSPTNSDDVAFSCHGKLYKKV